MEIACLSRLAGSPNTPVVGERRGRVRESRQPAYVEVDAAALLRHLLGAALAMKPTFPYYRGAACMAPVC
jgi:hypothetical protein